MKNLMNLINRLEILWGTAIKQLGLCDYNKKIIRMSLPLAVSNLKEANDTLFHELAHAQPSCGHNNEWKEACVKLCNTRKTCTSKYNCKTSTFAKTKHTN
jgi:hypothetical protein